MTATARPSEDFDPDLTDGQDHGLQHDLQVLARQSRDRRRMLGMPPAVGGPSVTSGCAENPGDTDGPFIAGLAGSAEGGDTV